MKEIHPGAGADQTDDPDPWVREGLRALREQVPSDESRRAMLAHLGIANEVADAPAPKASRPLLHWLLGGVLLGALALALERWLG